MCAKGLDAGEGFLVGAEKRDGEIVFTPERTAFLSIPEGDPIEAHIRKLGIYTLLLDGRRYILGEDALRLSRAIKRPNSLVFPFRSGLPDAEGRRVLATMLSAILGAPSPPGEPVSFTVHSKPVDGDFPYAATADFWMKLLASLGYKPAPLPRGSAALLGSKGRAPSGGKAPAGAALVFGDTAVDVFVRSESGSLDFSLLRGTAWIDDSVARMKKTGLDQVRHVRENVLNLEEIDLGDPLQGPLEIYFEHQIHYTLQQLVAQMMKARLKLSTPLEIVATGSCARTRGFASKLDKGLKKVKLPFPVTRVVVPRDPVSTAAGGALLNAMLQAPYGPGPSTQAPKAAPRKASSRKDTGRISDVFRTATQRFSQKDIQASPSLPPPPVASPVQPAAAPGGEASGQLLDRLRRIEGRVAELEDQVLGEDHEFVAQMRLAAGVGEKNASKAMKDFHPFFKLMVDKGASDLFLSAGARPAMRMDGAVKWISKDVLTQEFCQRLIEALSGKPLKTFFHRRKGVDLAIEMKGIGRFRANLFHQRGRLGGVFRYIKEMIPTFEELNLPSKTLMKLAAHQRGLILVTGVAGSGKSTTIAGILEHINQSSNRHVVTIEDPIEYVFTEKQSVIDQREVGLDTENFMTALKSAVRQSPDVIFIGEMRDKETMEASISAAETGHLVVSTLHTVNAQQTVERIITYFPPHQHDLIRLQLSMVLQGVLSVRLLPKKGGRGRVPAVEIMLATPTIRDLVMTGKTKELDAAISEDVHFGNQTFNESLKLLYQSGAIDLEEALSAADNPDELKLEIRGILRGARAADMNY